MWETDWPWFNSQTSTLWLPVASDKKASAQPQTICFNFDVPFSRRKEVLVEVTSPWAPRGPVAPCWPRRRGAGLQGRRAWLWSWPACTGPAARAGSAGWPAWCAEWAGSWGCTHTPCLRFGCICGWQKRQKKCQRAELIYSVLISNR